MVIWSVLCRLSSLSQDVTPAVITFPGCYASCHHFPGMSSLSRDVTPAVITFLGCYADRHHFPGYYADCHHFPGILHRLSSLSRDVTQIVITFFGYYADSSLSRDVTQTVITFLGCLFSTTHFRLGRFWSLSQLYFFKPPCCGIEHMTLS